MGLHIPPNTALLKPDEWYPSSGGLLPVEAWEDGNNGPGILVDGTQLCGNRTHKEGHKGMADG
ncbi:hypothetical protein N7501_005585 [Penicillium viridicatum]|nr:hypothetical protein N7501_005585 [Penicillium viridicatum]